MHNANGANGLKAAQGSTRRDKARQREKVLRAARQKKYRERKKKGAAVIRLECDLDRLNEPLDETEAAIVRRFNADMDEHARKKASEQAWSNLIRHALDHPSGITFNFRPNADGSLTMEWSDGWSGPVPKDAQRRLEKGCPIVTWGWSKKA